MSDRALSALVSALLIAAAALFAIGVAIERHDIRSETSAGSRAATPTVLLLADADRGHELGVGSGGPPSQTTAAPPPERSERSGGETPAQRLREQRRKGGHEDSKKIGRDGANENGHESTAQIARERGGERIFGINPDATVPVALAVAVSVALAIAVWLLPGTRPAVAVAVFTLGATLFDAREVAHQVNESRTNLVVITSVVALLHLAASASAVLLIRDRRAPHAMPQSRGFSRA